MVKNLFFILLFSSFLFSSCKDCAPGEGDDKEKKMKSEKLASSAITVDDLKAKGKEFIGKEVTVKGTITHICHTSGKKMHIIGTDKKFSVKVETNGTPFDIKLESSQKQEIEVVGILREIKLGEHKDAEGHDHKDGEAHEHKEGEAHDHKDCKGHKDGEAHDHKDGEAHDHKDGEGHNSTDACGNSGYVIEYKSHKLL